MGLWSKLCNTFRPGFTGNIAEELEFHLDQRAEELMSDGMTAAEARTQARREFGSVQKWREETRDAGIILTLETWSRDLRIAVRGLARRPFLAVTAIASLALGIGGSTALFSVADAVVFKPLALPDPARLYSLEEFQRSKSKGSNGPRLKDWQTLSSFQAASGYYGETLVWRGPSGNESVHALRTYTGFLAVTMPKLSMGRLFSEPEERGTEPVALMTDSFLRQRFPSGRMPEAITVSGVLYRIVGVLDASVGYPDDIDLWIPAPAALQQGSRQAGYLDLIARLKPEVSPQQANAEVAAVAQRLAAEYPGTDAGLTALLTPFAERLTRQSKRALYDLLAAANCRLLMICINVAALLLTRGAERERESAIRSALGASAGGLVRLYWTEALILAVAGGILGVVLCLAGVDVFKQLLPQDLPRLVNTAVDWRAIAFALAVSLVSAMTAGLIPAWLAARRTQIREGARGTIGGRASSGQLRMAFAVVEIALSLILVTTAMRLTESFLERSKTPPGLRVAGVVTASVPFPWTVNETRLSQFTTQAIERFTTLPGVTSAGLTDQYPQLGGTQDREVRVAGNEGPAPVHTGFRLASPEYFDIMKIRLLAGRMFAGRKARAHEPAEFIANEAFAQRYFAVGRPADGQRIAFANEATVWHPIVGVVANVQRDPAHPEGVPELYTYYANDFWPQLNFVLESTSSAATLAPLIRAEVAKLDGSVIVKSVSPLEEKLGTGTRDSRIRSTLVSGLAALALILMSMSIYGLIAGDVSTRWREFGVRLALGATQGHLRLQLMRKTAGIAALGMVGGWLGVWTTSRLLSVSLTELPPLRFTTAAVVCLLIGVTALAAIVAPLRRMSRIDPVFALRQD